MRLLYSVSLTRFISQSVPHRTEPSPLWLTSPLPSRCLIFQLGPDWAANLAICDRIRDGARWVRLLPLMCSARSAFT